MTALPKAFLSKMPNMLFGKEHDLLYLKILNRIDTWQ